MKKILSLLLAVLLTLSLLSGAPALAEDAPFELKAEYDVSTGSVTAVITAARAVTLANYDLRLSWDSGTLRLGAVQNGQSALFPSFLSNAEKGTVSAMSGGSDVTVAAGAVLVTFTLSTVGSVSGETTLSVKIVDAADENGTAPAWCGESLRASVSLTSAPTEIPLELTAEYDRTGGTVSAALKAKTDCTLANYDLRLSWDVGKLRLDSVENAQTERFPSFLVNKETGVVSAMSSGSNVTVAAGETLLTLTLTRAEGAEGETTLRLTVADAADESGRPTPWRGTVLEAAVYLKGEEIVAVTGVTLNKSTLELTVGNKAALSATVLPENAANRAVRWQSANPAVASVDENGVVTAVKAGKTTVTVTTEEGGETASCEVTVKAAPQEAVRVTGVSLNKTALELFVGESAELTATVTPADADNRSVSWRTDNDSVAAVTQGTVTAAAPGTTRITVITTDGGFEAVCTVTVKALPTELTGIELTGPASTRNVEGMPLNLDGLTVTAVYSDGSRAAVTDYTLSSYDPNTIGTQTITVTYGDKTATFTVTVAAKTLTGISVSKKPAKLSYVQGEALQPDGLEVMGRYDNGTSAPVTGWTLSGYDAQVLGSQTVTVSLSGFTASFLVTVSAPVVQGNVARPVMSLESYMGGKSVSLSCATEDAEIFYTLDGSIPDAGSAKYFDEEPIQLNATKTLKAIAIKDGVCSAVTTAKITVSQVGAPAPNPASSTVAAGTLVTLRTDTVGARIYYTEDGTRPLSGSGETFQYNGAIIIDKTKTIKAIAVKDGYRNSAVTTVDYEVPVVEVPKDYVSVSLGSVTAAAGDTASVPLYIFTSDSMITELRVKVCFNKDLFENVISVTPAEALDASALFSSVSGGTITLIYSGEAIESGEICTLNFTSLASLAAGTTCDIEVNLGGSTVKTTLNGDTVLTAMNAVITLTEADRSKYSANVTFTNENGCSVDSAEALEKGGEVETSISIEDRNGTISSSASVYLALYGREGYMISVECWKVDLSDPCFMFTKVINIPLDEEIGAIKIMVLSETMVPLVAASELAGSP